jgi:hypothetical protein
MQLRLEIGVQTSIVKHDQSDPAGFDRFSQHGPIRFE